MKNVLFKMGLTMMVLLLVMGGEVSAMEPEIDSSSNRDEKKSAEKITYRSNVCGGPLLTFRENELIEKAFNEENLKAIESRKGDIEQYPDVMPIYMKIPSFIVEDATSPFMPNLKGLFSNNRFNLSYCKYDAPLHPNGFLRIPDGLGPFPCAVLCHGSEGPTGDHLSYANSLAEQGIASLLMNRFNHRIHTDDVNWVFSTTKDQLCLSLEGEMIETFVAAKLMASHPKIDPTKIGFIAWSRGGNVALECSLRRNINFIYPEFKPAFCVNYYTMPLIQRKDELAAPVLFLHGENDDYTPVSHLVDYVNYLSNNGLVDQNVPFRKELAVFDVNREKIRTKIVIYPNAGHAFDAKPPSWNDVTNIDSFFQFSRFMWNEYWGESFKETCSEFMNMRDCCVRALENNEGFIDITTNKAYSWSEFPQFVREKVKYGVTLEFNQKVGLEAWADSLAFIKKQIGQNHKNQIS